MPEAVAYLTYSGLTKYEETAITIRVNPELLNSAPDPHQAFSLFQSAPQKTIILCAAAHFQIMQTGLVKMFPISRSPIETFGLSDTRLRKTLQTASIAAPHVSFVTPTFAITVVYNLATCCLRCSVPLQANIFADPFFYCCANRWQPHSKPA